MPTRAADLETAILASLGPLLPGPPPPPTAVYAADTAKALLSPATMSAPPPGLTGPIVAPITVGASPPAPVDAVAGQLFLNTGSGKLSFFNGTAWKQLKDEDD